MLKVFLVEDESLVRQSLRDNIPWQQYGFSFAGEAGDGEMALPQIRQIKPDVLITDIKMPFMDGLTLAHIVKEELPDTRIIIISGYDDFEYARQAISEGVTQYLLKPITRSTMTKALSEIREKYESEQEQKDYLRKYRSEMADYERALLRNFFEKVFEGKLSMQEVYDEAKKLSIDITAPCYNLLFFTVQEKKNSVDIQEARQATASCQEELLRYYLRFSEYVLFRWNVNTYGLLIMCDTAIIDEKIKVCLNKLQEICANYDDKIQWYAAAGDSVERFSMLADCYNKLNHIFAYRFINPNINILTSELLGSDNGDGTEKQEKIANVDPSRVDPELIKSFLSHGEPEEAEEFAENFMESLGEAMKSKLFRDYIVLTVRFAVIGYVESIGGKKDKILEALGDIGDGSNMPKNSDEAVMYIGQMLKAALDMREEANSSQNKGILNRALEYIDEHFSEEALSLNVIANYLDVSPNYFSALFSNEMNKTFIEYVTGKRIETAKHLLRDEKLHTADVATKVGYKDAHYFGFVFKKTVGISPRDYRNQQL